MITAILSAAVVWCLFYGKVNSPVLALICAGAAVTLALLGRHRHTRFITIDVLAQVSRLKKVNPTLKFWAALALMFICTASQTPVTGLFLTVAMFVLTVFVGGLKPSYYVRILALPISFLMMGGLVLLFEIQTQQTGVFGFGAFGVWFCVSVQTQARTALVLARSLGAISCLYLLSFTTPMSEIIGVLRRAGCPAVIIGLMYLIYRYIFILLFMYYTMRDAAKSRLGYATLRLSLSTSGSLYSNLLSRSYRQANRNFDAMESRCFDTEVRFSEKRERVTALQVVIAAAIVAFSLWLLVV